MAHTPFFLRLHNFFVKKVNVCKFQESQELGSPLGVVITGGCGPDRKGPRLIDFSTHRPAISRRRRSRPAICRCCRLPGSHCSVALSLHLMVGELGPAMLYKHIPQHVPLISVVLYSPPDRPIGRILYTAGRKT
jgi:hypothetical protein